MQYMYLAWALIFLAMWLVLYMLRKDTRKEMLSVSVLFGIGGLAAEKTNIQDWWQPLTVTGTPIGVEDFIIGFAIGGVAAVIYEELYRLHLSKRISRKIAPIDSGFYLLTFPLLYLTFFFLLHLGSFYSVVLAYSICIAYMLFTRRDLLLDSFMSGMLMLTVGSLIYLGLLVIQPAFIESFWFLPDTWYSELVLGVPIGEYIWFFLTGAYIGPLYEYIKHLRFSTRRT